MYKDLYVKIPHSLLSIDGLRVFFFKFKSENQLASGMNLQLLSPNNFYSLLYATTVAISVTNFNEYKLL